MTSPRLVISVLMAVMISFSAYGAEIPNVSANVIAAGEPVWVESEPNPEFAALDARVDIGTMRQVGDALEVEMRWPLEGGALRDEQWLHPNLEIPPGSQSVEREQIVCRPEGQFSYMVQSGVLSPTGVTLAHEDYDPAIKRKRAEKYWQESDDLGKAYGPDPRSLICWAAAHKCNNQAFTWPPSPNNTPLEHSAKAAAMRQDYNQTFFPKCKMPEKEQ